MKKRSSFEVHKHVFSIEHVGGYYKVHMVCMYKNRIIARLLVGDSWILCLRSSNSHVVYSIIEDQKAATVKVKVLDHIFDLISSRQL